MQPVDFRTPLSYTFSVTWRDNFRDDVQLRSKEKFYMNEW